MLYGVCIEGTVLYREVCPLLECPLSEVLL